MVYSLSRKRLLLYLVVYAIIKCIVVSWDVNRDISTAYCTFLHLKYFKTVDQWMFTVNGALLSSDVLHILHCLYDHRSFVEKKIVSLVDNSWQTRRRKDSENVKYGNFPTRRTLFISINILIWQYHVNFVVPLFIVCSFFFFF